MREVPGEEPHFVAAELLERLDLLLQAFTFRGQPADEVVVPALRLQAEPGQAAGARGDGGGEAGAAGAR